MERIIAWSYSRLSEFISKNKQQFIAATEDPADGVTIAVTFANPAIIPLVCRSLRGGREVPELALPITVPSAHVRVYAGLRRD
jgi:hypothetical protein